MSKQRTDPQPNTLGGVIGAARETQSLSFAQLGDLVGATKSMVYAWETDRVVPKAKYLTALARVLELPTADLFALAGVEYPHDAPSLPAMLRAEYDLPPEAIQQVQRYVERIAKKHAATEPRSSSKRERRNS